MKKKGLLSILLLSIVLVVAVSGYAQSPTEVKKADIPNINLSEFALRANSNQETQSPLSDKLVIYVTSKPLGTNQFHLMGKDAMVEIEKKYGVKTDLYESEDDPTNREENIRAAVNNGANIVVVMGTEWGDIIPLVASENPDVDFLIADQCVEKQLPNIHCTVFKEYEAAFLIGVMAGSLTETDHIGAIGALDIPFLHRYTDAFVEGAQYVNPDVKYEIRWVGGDNPFGDPARAKEQALAIYATGADQIFSATAGGDRGVFEAASQNNFYAYGVDVNNCPLAPGKIVDNLLKHVDVAIVDAVGKILTENPDALYSSVGVAEGAVGVGATAENPEQNKDCFIMTKPDLIKKVIEVQEKIINGEIKIEDPMFVK